MPWQRRPSWEYLPHLGGADVDGMEDDADDAARRGSPGMPADHGAAVRHGVVDTAREQEVTRPASGPPPGMQSSSSAAGSRDQRAEIRGRGLPPGRARQGGRGNGCAAAAAAVIRGHSAVPGPPAEGGTSRAQLRLDTRNAALARSFADHAERVARKTMDNIPRDATTARERIEALRRRVSQRQAAVTGGASAAATPAQRSYGDGRAARERTIEVLKIHQTHHGDGLQVNSGQSMGGGGGEAASGSGDTVPTADAGGQQGSAPTAAARHVAWHTTAGGDSNQQWLGGRAPSR